MFEQLLSWVNIKKLYPMEGLTRCQTLHKLKILTVKNDILS